MSVTSTDQRTDELRGSDGGLQQLHTMHEAITETVAVWAARVRREPINSVADVLTEAADAHERLIRNLDEHDPAAFVPAYRRGLRFEVVERLERGFAEALPGESLSAAHAELLDALSRVVLHVEEVVVRTEPADRYESETSDGWIRRWRKGWIRFSRRSSRAALRIENVLRRLTRSGQRDPGSHMQQVPLRHLASYHVLVRLPLALQVDHEDICAGVGLAIVEAGRVATEHVNAVLHDEVGARIRASEDSRSHAEPIQDVDRGTGNGDIASASVDVGSTSDQRAASMLERAREFQEQLRKAAEQLVALDVPVRARERSARLFADLQRDVFEADSFMLNLSKREVGQHISLRQRFEERDKRWIAYYARLRARVGLMGHLLDVREKSGEIEERLLTGILQQGIQPAREVLDHVEKQLDGQVRHAERDFVAKASADEVRRHLQNALEAVELQALELLRGGRLTQQMRTVCDEVVAELAEMIQALPERLALNVQDDSGRINPDDPPKHVALREHAANAYDALVVEKLRSEADAVAGALAAAREEVESVPTILRFNLGSALEDLDEDSGAQDQAAARELVVDGLSRSADVLRDSSVLLIQTGELFRHRAWDVLDKSFLALHERLQVEARIREQMLDLRSRAQAGLREMMKQSTEHGSRAVSVGRVAYRRLLRRSHKWIRLGQAAAGLAEATEEERFKTLHGIAGTGELLAGFPLVYQRLFTFEPVRDPSLLEGRERDLQYVRNHVEHRKSGLTNALVLTGFHGSGHTSFLNVLRQTVLDEAGVRTLDLRSRLSTEKELVRALAGALRLNGATAATLDELGEAISARETTEEVQACFVEHLEHLYIRQIGGTELVQAFLTFVSRTDAHVLWILSVSDYGWQVIRTAEPAASRLVVVHALSPVTRAGLEALVINRHRRSGLPLRFEAPSAEANPLLARRLRKARTDKENQSILRADYFDRLHRASGQNVMLALFYWLRSIDMDEESELIRVRPVEPLSFAFLQSLTLEHAFTLKALLEHASLTVQEHSALFLVSPARSDEFFEALANLLLIEPLENHPVQNRFTIAAVLPDVRYRIRPLLIHPVMQYLRGKNVLH